MYLGQDVFFSHTDMISSSNTKKIKYIAPLIAGVAAVFVFLFSYFGMFYSSQPYLFVDVDINPSIGFEVDDSMNIKTIHSYNKDAENIADKMNMKDAPFMETIMDYFKETEIKGFLTKDSLDTNQKNYVLITTSLNPKSRKLLKDKKNAQDKFDAAVSELENSLDIKYGSKIDLIVIKTDDAIRDMSVEKDMSMGRCLLYNKLKQMGDPISLDEAKSGNINLIMRSKGIDKNTLDSKDSIVVSTPIKVEAKATTKDSQKSAKSTIKVKSTPKATMKASTPGTQSSTNTPNPKKANETNAKNTPNAKNAKNTPNVKNSPENNYNNAVHTPMPTDTQIRATGSSVSVKTGRYDFENGLHGFKTMNDFKYYNDSEKVLSGLKSMKIRMMPGKDELVNTYNVDESIGQGSEITFNVWIPETDGLRAVEAFYQDANWGWTGNWVEYDNLTPNSWNAIKLVVKEDVKLPINAIGLKFAQKEQRFSCYVYIDDISWTYGRNPLY